MCTRSPRLRALVLAAAALSGCGRLRHSAALHPYDSAPPSHAAPWTPPTPSEPPPSPPGVVLPEPDHQQDLPDLIELALRNNPDTRRAWEEARAAAARLGRAEGAYLPKVKMTAIGGTSRIARAIPTGKEVIIGPGIQPDLALTWVLVDFGRRSADRDRALQELLATNYAFDRRLQTVVFNVQRSFFTLDAARASVGAAEATLEAARTVEAAASDRMGLGLATKPEVLLASQERYRSEYELTDAKGAVQRTHADLAANVGISPAEPLQVIDLSQEALPPALSATVEQVMDDALVGRPDLAAQLAALRARDAEVRRARSAFWPTLGFSGDVGGLWRDFRGGPPFHSHEFAEPFYGTFLNFEWTLFDALERENTLREAESQRNAAEAELASLRLGVLRDVWRSYADVKTAAGKYEFAKALLASAIESYEATLETYRNGLGNFLELLAAERELARARFTIIASKAELLTASAALAFSAGGGPAATPPPSPGPPGLLP